MKNNIDIGKSRSDNAGRPSAFRSARTWPVKCRSGWPALLW